MTKKSENQTVLAEREMKRVNAVHQEDVSRLETKIIVMERLLKKRIQEAHEASDIKAVHKTEELHGVRVAMMNLLEDLDAEKKKVEDKVQEKTKELREEQARLLASIHSLSFGFIIADIQGNILLQNPAITSILGAESKLTLMADVATLFGKNFDITNTCTRCVSEKTIVRAGDVSYGSKYLRISCVPIFFSKELKDVSEYVVLIEDETEAKVLERSRDEFFAVASHELRTPLTAIRGNAEMIQEMYADTITDKDFKEMIHDVHEASVRLITIVNDFLDVSRLEQGKITLKKEQFVLSALIEKVLKNLNKTASIKGVTLTFHPPTSPMPPAFADTARVEQVLFNIVGNAIKFTDHGDVEVGASLENPGFLKISVRDRGIGISSHNQALLFRKFQQAGEQMLARDVTQGTGLGLYISRLLIESMGGVIGLEKSDLGEGSTFYFTIPVTS